MALLEYLVRIIAPHECVGCRAEGRILCDACAERLPRAVARCYRCHAVSDEWKTCEKCRRESKVFRVQALTRYEDAAKTLVRRLKFGRARAAGSEIGKLLAPLLEDGAESVLLVHVPTATDRARQRGYDQAALIARSLARRSGVRHASLLIRIGQHRQTGANRAQRQQQLHNAFQIRKPHLVKNAHIILIDDIVTTGATLEAAAAVLKSAGAKKVEAIVFAQA